MKLFSRSCWAIFALSLLLLQACNTPSPTSSTPASPLADVRTKTTAIQTQMSSIHSQIGQLTSAELDDPGITRALSAIGLIGSLNKSLNNPSIDLSKMSVEDAVMMMFMLISDDARNDLRNMLEQMAADTDRKKTLRASAQAVYNAMAALKAAISAEYSKLAEGLPTPAATPKSVTSSLLLTGGSQTVTAISLRPGQRGLTFTLNCPTNYATPLALQARAINPISSAILATAQGTDQLTLSYSVVATTPTFIEVISTGVNSYSPVYCDYTLSYTPSTSPTHKTITGDQLISLKTSLETLRTLDQDFAKEFLALSQKGLTVTEQNALAAIASTIATWNGMLPLNAIGTNDTSFEVSEATSASANTSAIDLSFDALMEAMVNESTMYNTLSNISKMKHDAASVATSNIK